MTSGLIMTRDQIVVGLKDLLRRQKQVKVDVDSIDLATRLDRVGFDSLSILDFMYDVEDHFKVRMEIADLVRLQTVQDLIQYLEGKFAG
jgi:acyl carrier protein